MKGLVTFAVSLLTLSFFVLSCGDGTNYSEKLSPKQIRDALPTAANYQGWQGIWETDSWIVALRLDEPAVREKAAFKSLVAKALVAQYASSLSSSNLQSLAHLFAQQIDVEIIDVQDFTKPATKNVPVENLYGFGRVHIKDSLSTFAVLLQNAGIDLPDAGIAREKALIQAQFDGLSKISGVAWAEPNLFSEIQTAPKSANAFAQPPEITNVESNISGIMTSIKWDVAQQHVADKGLEQREVVVAVIDTGVDPKVAELEGRIFINEAEAKGKPGQDNDGNLYKYDVNGIDATIERGDIDVGVSPVPGSADVGGPGAKCPAPPGGGGAKTDKCGHGTHVAGIIAGRHGPDSDPQMMGVCPACKIVSMRVTPRCLRSAKAPTGPCKTPINPPKEGEYEEDDSIPDIAQVRALVYALKLVKPGTGNGLYVNVINLSLGKYYYNRSMASLVRRLRQNDVVVVAAAGNNNTETPMFPAAYGSVLAVCATETKYSGEKNKGNGGLGGQFSKTSFSNFGDWVDVCSPGAQIPSTVPGHGIGEYDSDGNVKSGTSQAGPAVAGVAAFLRSVIPNLSADEVVDRIKRYANPDLIYNQASVPYNANFGGSLQNVPFYSLGTGYLDMANALKKEKESYAFLDESSGRTKQNIGFSNGGCLVSSVGARYQGAVWNILTTMPFLLAQFWLLLKFVGSMRTVSRKRNAL